jgi:long-chain fatty acid transport protein
MKTRLLVVCTVMLCGFGFTEKVFGLGLDNAAVGIKASVMGTAFTGIADDASAVHHNPAGLVFNDKEILYTQLYAHYQFVNFTHTGPAGKDESDERYINPGFFTSKTYDKWAFGFGYYLPFGGGGYSFDDLGGIPGNDVEILLALMAIHPAVSYQLRPDLSVGVGVFMYMGTYEQDFLGYENGYDG